MSGVQKFMLASTTSETMHYVLFYLSAYDYDDPGVLSPKNQDSSVLRVAHDSTNDCLPARGSNFGKDEVVRLEFIPANFLLCYSYPRSH